jgi:two-component system phosphate regulon sensor histidine kinase PhoR
MQLGKNIKWMPALMMLTIIAIAGFQVYWLSEAYEREGRTLDMRTNFLFRETIFQLQSTKLKLDRMSPDGEKYIITQIDTATSVRPKEKVQGTKVMNLANILLRRAKDSGNRTLLIRGQDTLRMFTKEGAKRRSRLMQFLFDVDSIQDSIRIKEVQATLTQKLKEQKINVAFNVERIKAADKDEPVLHHVTVGFSRPTTYKLTLQNKVGYLLGKITVPILSSLFLVAFTFLSFSLLYRNLLRQRRLADIKNEFISNITHELKTPIATVSVAIEALRSFNANMNPERTKEYLDISANELQRLSLLVDKVLKLSMFEKKEIELKYEPLNMTQLVEEVTSSLRLQFENKSAVVAVKSEGDTTLQGDRLHLVSVIFNLLDNALKYSEAQPNIEVYIQGSAQQVQLTVKDRGIGIAEEYHGKIFEKFFRVPTGNLHNAKGYGLGLSYVAHVVRKHKGEIRVASQQGQGSSFIVSLPKHLV